MDLIPTYVHISSFISIFCFCDSLFCVLLFYLVRRSLAALSLILALLLFKPAPLYILDEVDAALDLSHTQNIGQLIKNHFKHSQVGILKILFFSFATIVSVNYYVITLWIIPKLPNPMTN